MRFRLKYRQFAMLAGGLVAMASTAQAQYQVQTTGRLLDYNPQVGGGNYYSRPTSPLLLGNSAASGNLRGGLSFQGYSPINDPASFRAAVGSSTLSAFLRDSVSPSDSYAGNYFDARQFYIDPSRTAPTASFLQRSANSQYGNYSYNNSGFAGPGPQAGPSIPTLNRFNQAAPKDPGFTYNSPTQDLLDQRTAIVGTNELYSSIFGVGRAALPKAPSLPIRERRPGERGRQSGNPDESQNPTDVASLSQPLDLRLKSDSGLAPLNRPIDMLMRGETQRELSQRGIGPPVTVRPNANRPEANADTGNSGLSITPFRVGGTRPGADLYTDLRLALELERNPNATWKKDMFGNSSAAPGAGPPSADDPKAFVDKVLKSSVRSLARPNREPINEEVTQAEAALQLGDYYEAAAHFERAARLDPLNPLPLIGKGNALLAAGEYVSASVYLLRGLERFPEFAKLDIDVTALMGGGQIVDLRRAEIMKLLEQNEDASMRFLLGYLEYYSGQQDLGMRNLEKAAENADPGSLLLRLPVILRGPAPASQPIRKPAPAGE